MWKEYWVLLFFVLFLDCNGSSCDRIESRNMTWGRQKGEIKYLFSSSNTYLNHIHTSKIVLYGPHWAPQEKPNKKPGETGLDQLILPQNACSYQLSCKHGASSRGPAEGIEYGSKVPSGINKMSVSTGKAELLRLVLRRKRGLRVVGRCSARMAFNCLTRQMGLHQSRGVKPSLKGREREARKTEEKS